MYLVSVHRHSLRAPAKFSVSSRADGSATSTVSTTLLEGQQLLGAEGLVVDLRGSLDEILQVGSEEEVSEVDEFTVVLVFDIDDTPAVLATANLLAIDDDGLFGANNGKGDKTLGHELVRVRYGETSPVGSSP